MIFAAPGLGLGVKTRPYVTGGLGVSVPILPPVFDTEPIPIGVGVVDDVVVYGLDTALLGEVVDLDLAYAVDNELVFDVVTDGAVGSIPADLLTTDPVTDLGPDAPTDCPVRGKVVEEQSVRNPTPIINHSVVDDAGPEEVVDDV